MYPFLRVIIYIALNIVVVKCLPQMVHRSTQNGETLERVAVIDMREDIAHVLAVK